MQHHPYHVVPNPVFHPPPVILNVFEETVRVVFEIDENITPMTIGMDEIVFYQHLKESRSPHPSNELILLMIVSLIV